MSTTSQNEFEPASAAPTADSSLPQAPPGVSRGLGVLAALSVAQLISLLGSQLSGFGLGVWVYQRTGSATLYGMTVVVTLGPALLAQPWAGGFVDRRGPVRALLLSNGTAAAGMTMTASLPRGADA